MPILFEPPKPHECDLPSPNCHYVDTPNSTLPQTMVCYPLGTMYHCEVCDTVFELKNGDFRYWCPLTKRQARRAIKRFTYSNQSGGRLKPSSWLGAIYKLPGV